MKHLLNQFFSRYLRKRVWERYKRLRLEAWGVRRKEVIQSKAEVLSTMCSNGPANPLLVDITMRGKVSTSSVIRATYNRLNQEANRLRDLYFFLQGEPRLT